MYGRIAMAMLVAAGIAVAEGKPTIAEQLRGGKANQQIRDQIGAEGNAGAGYVQKDFLAGLLGSLSDQVGEKRALEMMKCLEEEKLAPQEVTDLMNGKMTESQLASMCKARKGEADRIEAAVDEAVDEKNRKCFFGMLIIVVVCECKCEDGDFLKQMLQGMESMGQAGVDRLMRGDVSTATVGELFGFGDKAMCKEMQDALNKLRSSPLANHPMCESTGLGEKGKYKPEDFPKPAEGMPGCGDEFKDGKAGGLPFDTKLPPLPFAGANMGFAGCGEKPTE